MENNQGKCANPPRSLTIDGTAVARIVASMATRATLNITASRMGPLSERRPTCARVIGAASTESRGAFVSAISRSNPLMGLSIPARRGSFARLGTARRAGVIFFKENISSSAQIADVVQLREAQAQSPAAALLLLMTDQERGLVRRLPGEPRSWCPGRPMRPWTAFCLPRAASAQGQSTGTALASALDSGQLNCDNLQMRRSTR